MSTLTRDRRTTVPDAAHERWHERDLDSAARAVRGFRLALGLGAALWVLLVVLFYGVTHV